MPHRRAFGTIMRRRRTGKDRIGRPEGSYYPGWYVRYRRKGKQVMRYGGPTRKIAEAYLRRLHERVIRQELLGEHAPSDILFDDFVLEYLAYSEREHTPSTTRTRKWLIEKKIQPFFKGRRMADLNRQDIERVLAANAHLSAASRNRILSGISVLFKRALELGYVADNPATYIRRSREYEVPLPLVPIADQMRLLAELPSERRPFFLTLLDTGVRLGELLQLEWQDVEMESRSLLIRLSKNRKTRVVRMSLRVTAAIEAERPVEADASDLVFPEAKASDGRLRWAWRRSYKKAAAAAGHRALRIHDLRHLAAINLVRAGIDLPTVQAHLGHKKLSSTLRYAAYADRTASARAAEALDKIFADETLDEPDEDAAP